MVRKAIAWVLIIVVSGSVACEQRTTGPGGRPLLSGACSYLWQQQQKDGSWRSQNHKVLSSGQALTPFILWSLLQVPDSLYSKDPHRINRGIQYIRDQIDSNGVLGYADPDLLEYPNYANAYALMVFSLYGEDQDQARIQKLQQHLLDQQFTEARGIFEDDWVFGGWGFGEMNMQHGESGQVDLSHTRRVLQALISSGYPRDSLKHSAGDFLDLLQKKYRKERIQPAVINELHMAEFDGGFYYSPVVWGANKGGQDVQGQFRSYPTATCDGFLASNILGNAPGDQQAAMNWLVAHPSLFTWDGFSDQQAGVWSRAMQYYHLMVRSEAYTSGKYAGVWPESMKEWLLKEQQQDGSFSNPNGAISKEDDPLMATSMAVVTLLNCHRADNWPIQFSSR